MTSEKTGIICKEEEKGIERAKNKEEATASHSLMAKEQTEKDTELKLPVTTQLW